MFCQRRLPASGRRLILASRIRAFEHCATAQRVAERAFRTGIAQSTGDLGVLQHADPAYEPDDYASLVTPLLDGRADVVYGSRFLGKTHRVQSFWYGFLQRTLTLAMSAVHNCDLSDLETGQKAFGNLIRGLLWASDTIST